MYNKFLLSVTKGQNIIKLNFFPLESNTEPINVTDWKDFVSKSNNNPSLNLHVCDGQKTQRFYNHLVKWHRQRHLKAEDTPRLTRPALSFMQARWRGTRAEEV